MGKTNERKYANALTIGVTLLTLVAFIIAPFVYLQNQYVSKAYLEKEIELIEHERKILKTSLEEQKSLNKSLDLKVKQLNATLKIYTIDQRLLQLAEATTEKGIPKKLLDVLRSEITSLEKEKKKLLEDEDGFQDSLKIIGRQ